MAARLLYIGLWNFADDNGVLIDDVRRVKAAIFPYDSNTEDSAPPSMS